MKALRPSHVAAAALGGSLLLAFAAVLGLSWGASTIGLGDVIRALFYDDAPAATADIVLRIRLPRVVLGALVGACLATAGALFQALLRNPLADPYVLGVSGGAALGGVAAIALGGGFGLVAAASPVFAFAGALAVTALLFALGSGHGRLASTHLLLTGVVFNAFASALIVFMASMAGLVEATQIFVWLIGHLAGARAAVLPWLALFTALGLLGALSQGRALNLLTLGEETAAQLGVSAERARRRVLLSGSLLVGAAVSVSGLIGFVGLIVPHALRLTLGSDHRLLLPSAALVGASFLVVCDALARSALPGRELPVGAITALVGGPIFLWLLRRQALRGWLT